MNIAAIFWLLVAILGLFLVVLVFKKSKMKGDAFKSMFYLGLAFTLVGLFERFRYNEWGLLPIGLIFVLAGWVNRKKWGKN